MPKKPKFDFDDFELAELFESVERYMRFRYDETRDAIDWLSLPSSEVREVIQDSLRVAIQNMETGLLKIERAELERQQAEERRREQEDIDATED